MFRGRMEIDGWLEGGWGGGEDIRSTKYFVIFVCGTCMEIWRALEARQPDRHRQDTHKKDRIRD